MIDWVPCQFYDDVAVGDISQGATIEFGLLNASAWSSDIEIVGDIEGEDEGYKILRIVGYWSIYLIDPQAPATTGTVGVRLWPGFQDQANQVPITPGPLFGPGADRAANEKWWWERCLAGLTIQSGFGTDWEPVSHPWHIFLDIKPDYWCPSNMVPTCTVQNATDARLRFSHRWRMLVAKKG